MTKGHAGAELQQARFLSRSSRGNRNTKFIRCAGKQRRIPCRLGRRQEQNLLCLHRKLSKLPSETRLQLTMQAAGHRKSAFQMRRSNHGRQLQQGKRIAARLGNDLVAHGLIERAGMRSSQKRSCAFFGQAANS